MYVFFRDFSDGVILSVKSIAPGHQGVASTWPTFILFIELFVQRKVCGWDRKFSTTENKSILK